MFLHKSRDFQSTTGNNKIFAYILGSIYSKVDFVLHGIVFVTL